MKFILEIEVYGAELAQRLQSDVGMLLQHYEMVMNEGKRDAIRRAAESVCLTAKSVNTFKQGMPFRKVHTCKSIDGVLNAVA